MTSYKIEKLKPEDYYKCSNIWDMNEKPMLAKVFYDDLVSGNRVTFIYLENKDFIGEGSLVFKNPDSDYTIPDKRIYLSRMIVKEEYRNHGIGGIIVDFLIDYAQTLGFEEIALGVDMDNMNARHLYEKKGFTDVLYVGEDNCGKYVKLLKKLE